MNRLLVVVAALTLPCLPIVTSVEASAVECVKVIGGETGVPNSTMDPAFQNVNDDSHMQFAVYNRLLDLDDKMQVIPALATSWTHDGLAWTFKLAEGVKFHDGKDFGAKDVVYTFRRLMDPKVGSPAAKLLTFLTPDGIAAVDDHTVRFTTSAPIGDLPTLLAFKYNLIVPAGAKSEDLKLKEDGTGPFIQEVFTPSETRRVLRRNANYWKPGLPKAACLELNVMTEEVTRTAAIESGAVDLLLNTGPASVPVLKANPNVQVLASNAGTYWTLSLESDVKPFTDLRVRQAIKAAIDRQGLVDTVMLGYAEAGNDTPVPPSWPTAYTHDVKPRDIAKAKALLAEAGYPNGIDIELNTGEAQPGMMSYSQAVQQMVADAGIRMNLVNNPPDSYWDVIWNKKPMFVSSWTIRPVEEGLQYTFTSSAAYNEGHWKNAEYDALLAKARIESDPASRAKLFNQAQEILSNDGAIVIPLFLRNIAVTHKGCSGYVPHMQDLNVNFENLTCEGKGAP